MGRELRPSASALFSRAGARGSLITLLALGLAGCSAGNSSFLHPYGPVAADQRHLFFWVIGWMMIVCVPVFVLVPLFAWRYRRRNGAAAYRPKWEFSWPLEVVVWGVPVVVVAILAVLLWSGTMRLDPYATPPSAKPPLEIEVVGLDWKWLFIYPEEHIATVGIVAFPTDRPVRFRLTSDTVMQSFFIPALGSQIYAMAGMVTQLNLMADRPGQVEGENTQFNGMGFQSQNFTASAMKPEDFSAWVAKVRSSGKPLDNRVYGILSERSTTKEVSTRLGSDAMPPGVLYFSQADPGLFADIVDSYRAQARAGAPSAWPKATSRAEP